MKQIKYSVVIPVFNRPQEVDELLRSLAAQHYRNIEIIIVEDGSTLRCDGVADRYRDQLTIHYFYKPNTGPGPSRNFGYAHAQGDYLVVFDSDCILPPTYFDAVENTLLLQPLDAWGGPDRAHEQFTPVQRAMGYTMASMLTTGGIRGGKKRLGWFQPRSFNMGISRNVFLQTGGFKFDRYAEDIEFSIRMKKAGFRVGLIPEAFVYHKRRTNFKQFYEQVFNFGRGRAMVGKIYPEEIKLTHWFPTVFVMGIFFTVLLAFLSPALFALVVTLYGLYLLAIFFHSWSVNKSVTVACLSIPAALLQLSGYGIGFFKEKMTSTKQQLKR